tara:strand:+ start:410 stop:604 length:195 start_codon:yes stop_codon:yes gene_type:complete
MQIKNILIVIGFTALIISGLYYLMSPYQKCIKKVDILIDRETNNFEKNKLLNTKEFYCMKITSW